MGKIEENRLGIHLDVGHDSIGWCVTEQHPRESIFPRIPGAGVVLFPADDCLANERRAFRRQRRHIRATRQRIARMKALLLAKGVLTEKELSLNPTAFPWKLAARVLAGGKTLSWLEMWCVLRWYAHNRGYDGNVLSSLRSGRQVTQEDIEKNAAAREMMAKFGTTSMAATMCRYMEIEPDGKLSSSMKRFKGLGVSFDRSIVVAEVSQLLGRHLGVLKGLDADFMHLLLADPAKEAGCLRSRTDLPFRVPARYWGGVLFGQLAPRFDNRLIGTCPVSGAKLPSKATPEFLLFRWTMMLANTSVGEAGRRLSVEEMARMNADMKRVGGYTKGNYKKLVAEVTGEKLNNVDALLTAPDADKSLVCYPGLYALTRRGFDTVLEGADLRRLAHALFRGKSVKVDDVRALVPPARQDAFDALVKPEKQRGKKKNASVAEILEERLNAELPSGRAPYARDVLSRAAAAVLSGNDPREKGGILYRDATKADILPEAKIDQASNNHLIRHRVKIVLRLMKDIIHDYAENNPARIAQVTVEMARDLKDLSGKKAKEIAQEMNFKTAQHRAVAKKLAEHLHCDVSAVSAGLIRKARVADDMGYTCPYTGWKYDLQDVVSKNVDLDHILPRSQRATDSLDSMVLTYTEVNRMKGARTGLEFVREFGGQRVNGRENLVVLDEAKYRKFAEGLKLPTYSDDRKRQKRRIEKLLKLHSDEMGMTEGMLTRTSYITTLTVKAIRGLFVNCGRMPQIVHVPGRVTAELRKQWNLLGVLATIDPRVLDAQGNLRIKSEIRGITHMHHAVDAITLGLAATVLPCDGRFWATMCKRRVTPEEGAALEELGSFRITAGHEPRLVELPDDLRQSIAAALAEQRVVVHQPQERFGLKVQQKAWGVEKVENGMVSIRQRSRDEKTGKITIMHRDVPESKAFGLHPTSGKGKLKAIRGVLIQEENFGVVLGTDCRLIRYQHVWQQIKKGEKLIRRNDLVRIDAGRYQGVWRVAGLTLNSKNGILLDLHRVMITTRLKKSGLCKENVILKTLLKNGLHIIERRYTGVASCLTTSSTSPAKAPRSR